MDLFGKMKLNSYLCCAKKERDGLLHQRFLVRQHDTVQLTYPIFALLVTLFKKKMMVNDTIVNAKNLSDRLCNEVILWSNDFARDLGVTYGELWAGITIFVVLIKRKLIYIKQGQI